MGEKVKRPVGVWVAMGLLAILGATLIEIAFYSESESVVAQDEAAGGIAEFLIRSVTPAVNGLGCLISIIGVARAANWGRLLAKVCLASELVLASIDIFLLDSDFYSDDPYIRLSMVVWFVGHVSMAIVTIGLLTFGDAVNSYFGSPTKSQGNGKNHEPPPPPVFET